MKPQIIKPNSSKYLIHVLKRPIRPGKRLINYIVKIKIINKSQTIHQPLRDPSQINSFNLQVRIILSRNNRTMYKQLLY